MDFESARGAYVVLDATEVNRDWYLSGLEFQLLRFLVRTAGLLAAVPSSVYRETLANHERESQAAAKHLKKALTTFERLAGRSVTPQYELEPTDYEERLKERLESVGVDVLPYPEAGHELLVERAASRRPPFDQSGSGYRDALTWETCLELARAGKRVFLISEDNDFATKDGALAPELVKDASNLLGSVSLVRRLGPWLMTLLPWEATNLKEAAAEARDEEVAAMFAPWDIFEDQDFEAGELGLPPSTVIESVMYSGSGDYTIHREAHSRAIDGSFTVEYRFPIEFEADVTMSTEDARSEGFISSEEVHPTGRESINTVVSMVGRMTITHDERGAYPLLYDQFTFYPASPNEHYERWRREKESPTDEHPTLFEK